VKNIARILCFVLFLIINNLLLVAHAQETADLSNIENIEKSTLSLPTVSIYEYLPGFSELTKEQLKNIHPSFISSIYAGIVSGLTAGIIVGIVIFLIQKWSETRQLRRTLDREISIFKEEARSHLECTDSFALHDAEIIPDSAKSLNMSLKEKPVDLWQEHLLNNQNLIVKLKRFQASIFKFKGAANKLDNRLWMLIRKYNSDRDAISANDPPIYIYCIGKITGMSDEEIIPFMEFGGLNGKVNPSAITCYNKITNNEEFSALSKEYIKNKYKLESMLNDLREELGVKNA